MARFYDDQKPLFLSETSTKEAFRFFEDIDLKLEPDVYDRLKPDIENGNYQRWWVEALLKVRAIVLGEIWKKSTRAAIAIPLDEEELN